MLPTEFTMDHLFLLAQLDRVREKLAAFPVPAAAEKTNNPEYAVLKAAETDCKERLLAAGICSECAEDLHPGAECGK